MKKVARKHNPYRTFAEYENQEHEIPAHVLKAMRDLNMKSSKLSSRELERHEAKRDVWREVLDGIDEIKKTVRKRRSEKSIPVSLDAL